MRATVTFRVSMAALGAGLLGAFIAAEAGLYDVAATSPHLSITYDLMHWVAVRSIARRAENARMPVLAAADMDRAILTYDRVCSICHGAPGRAPEAFAEGMNPPAPPLPFIGREWPVNRIFQATAYGLKMTGMPAFVFRMPEKDIWAIAALVAQLPDLTVADYQRRVKTASSAPSEPPTVTAGPDGPADPKRGRIALAQHGCPTCHAIPGLPGAREARTGPPLAGVGARAFIAGKLSRSDADLAAWIRDPQGIHPESAMPDMRVGPRDATDMIAYLRRLKRP